MRKLLSILIVLAMMCTAGTVFAETGADLYDLYDKADGERTWIGTAVPIMDGVAVTSPVGLPEKVAGAEIWDGTGYRAVSLVLPVADGKVLVLLHETDGIKPGIPSYDRTQADTVPKAGDLIARSGDWMRSRINRAVYDLSVITWNNREAYLLTLSGDTPVGSPLVTADGKLAGLVTAEYAEGANRYVALPVKEINSCLQEAAMLLDTPEADNRPDGYTVTMDGNLVTFDWSGMKLPETAEGEKLYHIVADSESSYLNYTEVTEELTQVKMLLTPGRTYISGLAGFKGKPDDLPDRMAITAVPEAEPMTEYGFRSVTFAIAEMPEDAPEGTMPTPVTEVTEALLRSGRACMYSVSSYTVDEVPESCSLLVSLTAPDGSNFRYESAWYYDPSIMEKDEWYTSLADMGLLDMMNANGYPEGTYEMSMYIDGKLADSLSFELIK